MRWYIKPPFDDIFVSEITGTRKLLLKLSLVVGWYHFWYTVYAHCTTRLQSQVWCYSTKK